MSTTFDPRRLSWGLVAAGLLYPVWQLIPAGAVRDPSWAWWAVGAVLLGAGLLVRLDLPFVRRHRQAIFYGSMWPVPLHFFLLAHANEMMPFYAVGSVTGAVTISAVLRSRRASLAFTAFVLALASALIALAPSLEKLAYWGSLVVVLPFAHKRLSEELRALDLVRQNQRDLERRVAERTRDLSTAYDRLQREKEENERLAEELRLKHKLEALGRLAGGIAHDFNNLLTAIRGYGELLEDDLPEGRAREDLGEVLRATQRGEALVGQLLAFARQKTAEATVLDLNVVVRELSRMLRILLSENVELEMRLCAEPARVLMNQSELERLFVNLAVNARDAMQDGGCLTIETSLARRSDVDSDELRRELAGDAFVRLVVRDTGVGMDAETLSRIFDPFFTTKEVGDGSGLGLSSVYGFVRQAGGAIRVRSQPDRGTCFEILLPIAELGAEEPQDVELPPEAPSGSERILLVEDEDALRRLERRILERCGYRVVECPDARRAERVLEADPEPIDLMVTDVVMPGMSGFELAHRARVLRPGTRFLFVSGHLDHASLRHHARPVETASLAKPFRPIDFARRVRAAIDAADAPTVG